MHEPASASAVNPCPSALVPDRQTRQQASHPQFPAQVTLWPGLARKSASTEREPAGQAQTLWRVGVRGICMLVLGMSPAEALGCLCPERIIGQRGVAVRCLLPGVVGSHPHAGRPRDLQLHGREQAPPDVLISHQECLGAFDRRQRGRSGTGERPARRSRQRRLRARTAVSTTCAGTVLWSRLSRKSIAGHTPESAWSQRTQGGFGSGGATVTSASSAISRANTSA